MKIWTTEEKGNEKIIAYNGDFIYRVNPDPAEIDNCVYDLKMKKLPTGRYFGIPFHYLKQINLQENKKYIEFLFGPDSSEHFRVTDEKRRNEIFEYFKTEIPGIHYSVEKYSWLKAAKKPLIALVVVTLLFCWTWVIANGMEEGTSYDVEGGRYNSFAGLVLIFASLGKANVYLIFGSLFAIALYSFTRKAKHPPLIHRLTLIKKATA